MAESTELRTTEEQHGGRTPHMLEEVGERIGRSLSGVVHGVRGLGDGLGTPNGGAPMERAEHLATKIGDRIGTYAQLAGLEARRMVARIREEAADIRAEAEVRARQRPSAGPEGEEPSPPAV